MSKIIVNGEFFELGGGSSQEIYSTEETVIGRWIDGKPIYRYTIEIETGKSGGDTIVQGTDQLNIDILIASKAIIKMDGANNTLISILPNNGTDIKLCNDNRVHIYIDSGTVNLAYKHGVLVIEYTKTTDSIAEAVTSKSSVKKSGTITVDGEQYEYELPDGIVSADSSAASSYAAHSWSNFSGAKGME